MQRLQNGPDLLAGKAIVNRLTLPARLDKTQRPHPGKMLGQGGLTEPDLLRQETDTAFPFQKMAKRHQTAGIGHGAEHRRRFVGAYFHLLNIHTC